MDKRQRKVNEYINDRQKTLPAYSADKVQGRCCDVATIKECYVIMLRHRNKKEYYVIMLRRRNIYSYQLTRLIKFMIDVATSQHL